MFENDICLCGNAANCPHKNECKRAGKHGPGIYTVALFYEEGKECEYFMKKVIKNEKL